jgi:hypothetical protein
LAWTWSKEKTFFLVWYFSSATFFLIIIVKIGWIYWRVLKSFIPSFSSAFLK